MARLEFWFDFASTYAYLSAMRIEALAADLNCEIAWRPFLLGPIFASQGWASSPFNVYPAKGRYMVRDLERITAARGLPFQIPEPFPANGLTAARIASVAAGEGWDAAWVRAVFKAEFAQGANIADDGVLAELLGALGQPKSVLGRAREANVKSSLRARGEQAKALGIFGAPTFVTSDREMFWGDDRLEAALAWEHAPAPS